MPEPIMAHLQSIDYRKEFLMFESLLRSLLHHPIRTLELSLYSAPVLSWQVWG